MYIPFYEVMKRKRKGTNVMDVKTEHLGGVRIRLKCYKKEVITTVIPNILASKSAFFLMMVPVMMN